jgi:1-acyl-sn-glycerol-3-phosphate acyltransferase
MIRTALFFVSLALTLIATAPKLLRAKYLHALGRKEEEADYVEKITGGWARLILRLTGSKVKVTGLENIPKDTPVVYISNHQGDCDTLAFLGYVPGHKCFISKIEILKVPILSSWMKAMHCVFMDRSNIKQSVDSINKGIDNLRHGYSVIIFPEGTRSRGPEMGEFKPGSFKLATRTGIPIVPVVIKNSYRIWEEKRRIRPAMVEMIISEPVETDYLTKEELKELPSKIKNIIMEKL